nr:NAD-dependent epimerase/dehydratase family protein [Polaromonas sp. UBA4122]
MSGECEADFDLGMRSNLDATLALLEACRVLKTKPIVVFASSLAVFGDSPEQPVPPAIEDNTLPTRRAAMASRNTLVNNWWPTTRAKDSFGP